MSQADQAASAADNVPVVGRLFGAYIRLMGSVGIGSKEAAQERVAAAGRLGTIQNVVARTQGAETYSAGGLNYPTPPKDYTGTASEWQQLQRYLGNTTKTPPKKQPTPPPKQPAPPAGTPPINPNAPWPAVEGPAGAVSWIYAAQWAWSNKDAWIAAAQKNPKWFKQPKKRKKLKPSALNPALMRRTAPVKAPTAQLAELTVPKITAKRIPTPKRSAAPPTVAQPVVLDVPTITVARLPTPGPTPRSTPTPRRSLLSTLTDPLTLSYLLGRPGAARITNTRTGSTIQYLTDPLTTPQTGALTSPLGAFAGVPSTADCSCSKKPGKKGKRKRRTICYEGTYRETASGTRKLRRQEVPCK